MSLRGSVGLSVLLLVPAHAWSQGQPLGPEFRVNTFTMFSQAYPKVASNAAGDFVVVWQSFNQDFVGWDVFGRRFDSSGSPLGGEFRVNTSTTNYQDEPEVASDPAGNFVVVWRSREVNQYVVLGQRYASSGAPLGSEFRVNSFTNQRSAHVASDALGNFVVVWYTYSPASIYDVFGQRYASSGVPLGPEFRVNTYTTDEQEYPSVAFDPGGNFVVAWTSRQENGGTVGVFGQRFSSLGDPLGPEFHINTATTSFASSPRLASDAAGNFVVIWYANDGDSTGVFGQRYASSGAPAGPEFRVNSYTTNFQGSFSVASDGAGDFVVAWSSYRQGTSDWDVFAQRFLSSGSPAGPEFRVNTLSGTDQRGASVASDDQGHFVVVWQSYVQDLSQFGVYGQRFGQIVPVELTGFDVE